jgi:hypothetical protein
MYDMIIRELDRRGDWTSSGDLAAALHISRTYARDLLNDAVRAGLAEKDSPRGSLWKICRAAHPAYGRDITFQLSYSQALQVIRACLDQEQALMDGPYVSGNPGRMRALHNGRVRIEQALPVVGRRAGMGMR